MKAAIIAGVPEGLTRRAEQLPSRACVATDTALLVTRNEDCRNGGFPSLRMPCRNKKGQRTKEVVQGKNNN